MITRTPYKEHFRLIENGAQLCSSLRAGQYAWPGGYQLAFITSDGGLLSFEAVRENLYQCVDSIRNQTNDGWRVVAITGEHESDEPAYCDHTSKLLWGNETEEQE